MELLVIRHAIAVAPEDFAETGQPDNLRPLTRKGVKRMKAIAEGLRDEVGDLGKLASSPFVRAVQTARIVADVFGIDPPEITASLVPGTPFEEFETWASRAATDKTVAVVGHDPHLPSLVTWLISGNEARIELRKGGACLIQFESGVRRSAGTLIWLLTPRQLRSRGQSRPVGS